MKSIFTVLVVIGLLYAWSRATNTAPNREHVDFASTIGSVQACSIHGAGGYITRSFVWVGWQVNIFIPGYGCISNDPGPIYIRLPGSTLTIGTWFKGWHRVPLSYYRLG